MRSNLIDRKMQRYQKLLVNWLTWQIYSFKKSILLIRIRRIFYRKKTQRLNSGDSLNFSKITGVMNSVCVRVFVHRTQTQTQTHASTRCVRERESSEFNAWFIWHASFELATLPSPTNTVTFIHSCTHRHVRFLLLVPPYKHTNSIVAFASIYKCVCVGSERTLFGVCGASENRMCTQQR